MRVHIYVEGGGDQRATNAALREGFRTFFMKAFPDRDQPRINPCGSREVAFDKFKRALIADKNSFLVLLVDSESPVGPGIGPWEHMGKQDGSWKRPQGVTNDHAHLMVQCMESWFFADQDALWEYYGKKFQRSAFPANSNIEQIAKPEVFRVLEAATKKTAKGKYRKTEHGTRLLAFIDPLKVRLASPHAERLCLVLAARLSLRTTR